MLGSCGGGLRTRRVRSLWWWVCLLRSLLGLDEFGFTSPFHRLVLDQAGLLFETLCANVACVGTASRMGAQVLVDITAMGKLFATCGTLVRLFASVQPLVVVQAADTQCRHGAHMQRA